MTLMINFISLLPIPISIFPNKIINTCRAFRKFYKTDNFRKLPLQKTCKDISNVTRSFKNIFAGFGNLHEISKLFKYNQKAIATFTNFRKIFRKHPVN